MFLVIVDADSKWMKIEIVNVATTVATVEQLRVMFARFGLPKVIITDNGTCFTSSVFAEFKAKSYSPFQDCPLSNGLISKENSADVQERNKEAVDWYRTNQIVTFPFSLQIDTHTTTGVAPAELIVKTTTLLTYGPYCA